MTEAAEWKSFSGAYVERAMFERIHGYLLVWTRAADDPQQYCGVQPGAWEALVDATDVDRYYLDRIVGR